MLHYAGEVTYCVIGFIDKNKDTLFQDFKRLLYNRSVSLRHMQPSVLKAPCGRRGRKEVGNFNVPAIHLLISALCMCACGLLILFVFAYLSYLYFPSSFFMSLTFSSSSSSISYLPQNMDPLRFQA